MAEVTSESYLPPITPRRATPLFTTLVLATVGLLIAGVVSVAALSGGTGNTPEDAVRALMQAAASGNVTAALGAIDPAEADAIRPGVTSIVADLQKLGILDASLNLDDVTGLSATFANVTMAPPAPLDASRTDLAAVTFTGGTVTTHVDVAQLALGTLLKNVLKGRAPVATRTAPLVSPGRTDPPIVTINRGGQWYVSIGYTVAEAARRRAGAAFPSAAASIPAAGAGSASDAVRQLVTAAVEGDTAKVIALMNPADTQALHDYGSLLPAHAPATPVTVSALDLAPTTVSDGTLVTISGFTAHAGDTTVSLAPGGCLQVTSPSAPHTACAPAGTNLGSALGVLTVEQGGRWYVDPYRTVLDAIGRTVSGVNLSQLQTMLSGAGAGPLGMLGVPGMMSNAALGCTAPAASAPSGASGASGFAVCTSARLTP